MKRSKILSLLLAVALVIAACTPGGGEADAPAADPPADVEAPADDAAPGNDDEAPADTPAGTGQVNPAGTFPIVDVPITVSIFSRHIGWVADFHDNRFTEWYQDHTNIIIDWQLVSPDDVATSLNLRLAAGDLPDIFMDPWEVTSSQVRVMGDAGMIIPLNDLIDRYGIETTRVLDGNPVVRGLITQDDGRILTLPQVDMCYHCQFPNKAWVYEPWLLELGLDIPSTTDEFVDMLRAFRDMDPDVVPLTGYVMGSGFPTITSFFMNSFIYTDDYNFLKVDNGVLTPVFNTDEWREGLRFLHSLHEEGLLSNETFTQDAPTMQALNGGDNIRIAVFPSLVSWGSVPGGTAHEEWTNYVPLTPLEGPGGVRFARHRVYEMGAPNAFMISSSNPYPEASFRFADALYDMETMMRKYYGRIDYEIRFAEPGEYGINGLPAIWTIMTESGNEHDQPNHAAWAHVGPHYRSADFRHGMTVDGDPRSHPEKVLYLATRHQYEPFAPPSEIVQPPQTFSETQASDILDIDLTIRNHVAEMFALFIIGEACLDNDWDMYLATLDGMGLARFVEIHQAAFDERWGGR